MGMARTSSRILSRAITGGGARLLRSRTLTRAPIWIYRAGLGFVFGSRLLMLEHTGRKSGLPRQVVLEVVDHPAPDTYVVPSGFGERAHGSATCRRTPASASTPAATRPRPPPHACSARRKPIARLRPISAGIPAPGRR